MPPARPGRSRRGRRVLPDERGRRMSVSAAGAPAAAGAAQPPRPAHPTQPPASAPAQATPPAAAPSTLSTSFIERQVEQAAREVDALRDELTQIRRRDDALYT